MLQALLFLVLGALLLAYLEQAFTAFVQGKPWLRPLPQFSLRSLFVATTLVAIVLGLACFAVSRGSKMVDQHFELEIPLWPLLLTAAVVVGAIVVVKLKKRS